MTNSIDNLLFDTSLVNDAWILRMDAVVDADFNHFAGEMGNLIDARYAADPNVFDGYSRVAYYFLNKNADLNIALRLFKADAAAKRQSWFQQLRYAECVAALGNIDAAYDMVEQTYKHHAEAVNGYASIAWRLRLKDNMPQSPWFCAKRDLDGRRLSPGYMLNVAVLAIWEGLFDEARSLIAEAYRLDPALVDGHARCAWGYYWPRHEYSILIEWMEIDHSAGKLSPARLLNLAQAYAAINAMEKAWQLVDCAYNSNSSLTDGYARCAWQQYWPKKEFSKLIEWMEKDHDVGKLSPAWELNIAQAYAITGNMEEAIKYVKQAYSDDSRLQDGYTRIGQAHCMPGNNYGKLLEYCLEDQRQNRLSDSGRLTLAEARMYCGDFENGLIQLQAAKTVPPQFWPKAIKIRADSFQWPLSPFPKDDSFLNIMLDKYAESAKADDERVELVSRALADIAIMRERIISMNRRTGMDLLAQIRDIVSNKWNNGGVYEPVSFLNAKLYYVNAMDILVLFNEIILSESDRFITTKRCPFIIDGGANIGTSLAYFKWLYPKSQIIAFEPNPFIYDICKRNITLNQWENITLYPYALAGKNGVIEFHCDEEMPMGSSLNNRPANEGRRFKTVKVEGRTLDEFMTQPLDLLKLDVEGAESSVICAAAPHLHKVRNGIIEYHYGDHNNSLPPILDALEKSGHEYIINEPFFLRHLTGLVHLTHTWSRSIFFKPKIKSLRFDNQNMAVSRYLCARGFP